MQRLSEIPTATVVVEGRYPALFTLEHVPGAWLADVLARLQIRYPEVQVASPTRASSRKSGPTGSSPPRSPRRLSAEPTPART